MDVSALPITEGDRRELAFNLEFCFLPLAAFRGVGNVFLRLPLSVGIAGSGLLIQVKRAVEYEIELGAFR